MRGYAGYRTSMQVETLKNGVVIRGSFPDKDVLEVIEDAAGKLPLIVADPPYSGIVSNEWDKNIGVDDYIRWTIGMKDLLIDGGSAYVWGGIGKPGNRVFFNYLASVEEKTGMTMRNLITWGKKRAYGKKDDYLFTREEVVWLVNGEKPRTFNIPLLETKRGYAGYSAKYPAKSEYLRRTNVWTDITEILRGKSHPTEKPVKLSEVMILTHTQPGEWVLDPFAGSGSTGEAAIKNGRKFVLVERDEGYFRQIVARLKKVEC